MLLPWGWASSLLTKATTENTAMLEDPAPPLEAWSPLIACLLAGVLAILLLWADTAGPGAGKEPHTNAKDRWPDTPPQSPPSRQRGDSIGGAETRGETNVKTTATPASDLGDSSVKDPASRSQTGAKAKGHASLRIIDTGGKPTPTANPKLTEEGRVNPGGPETAGDREWARRRTLPDPSPNDGFDTDDDELVSDNQYQQVYYQRQNNVTSPPFWSCSGRNPQEEAGPCHQLGTHSSGMNWYPVNNARYFKQVRRTVSKGGRAARLQLLQRARAPLQALCPHGRRTQQAGPGGALRSGRAHWQ
jgi:hypothetical protein